MKLVIGALRLDSHIIAILFKDLINVDQGITSRMNVLKTSQP